MTTINRKLKPITAAVGTAFVASLATASIANAESPFAVVALDNGYDQLARADDEGKCGEGKCGESKDESKAEGEGKCGESKAEGEGKCGESKDEGEGKCGESKAEGEGKCGEGKCGEGKCGEDQGGNA
ncbi:MAG: hypothetical protein P8Y69_05835 [Gammaproteobacteria bacterium]